MSNFSEKQKVNQSQMEIAKMEIVMRDKQSDKQFKSQCIQWAMQVTQPTESKVAVPGNPSGKVTPPTTEAILANAAKFEAYLNEKAATDQ